MSNQGQLFLLPGLKQIRQRHGLEMDQVAQEADLPLRQVYIAEIGGRIEEEYAVRLLTGLSRLARTTYKLRDGLIVHEEIAHQPTHMLPKI
ncbi:MAG: hypothetical protein J2P36_18665 [Ktedonobacteraceae bacterium]|nr:hypothetical protein [Ktedonobacteraceae bacterium]